MDRSKQSNSKQRKHSPRVRAARPALPCQAKHHTLGGAAAMFLERGDFIFDARSGWFGFLKTTAPNNRLVFVASDGEEHTAHRDDCEVTPIAMVRMMEGKARGWRLLADPIAPGEQPIQARQSDRVAVRIGHWVHDGRAEEQGVVVTEPLGDLVIYQMEDGRFGAGRVADLMIDPDRVVQVPKVDLSSRRDFGGDPFFAMACRVVELADQIDEQLDQFTLEALDGVQDQVQSALRDANNALAEKSNEVRSEWVNGTLDRLKRDAQEAAQAKPAPADSARHSSAPHGPRIVAA